MLEETKYFKWYKRKITTWEASGLTIRGSVVVRRDNTSVFIFMQNIILHAYRMCTIKLKFFKWE